MQNQLLPVGKVPVLACAARSMRLRRTRRRTPPDLPAGACEHSTDASECDHASADLHHHNLTSDDGLQIGSKVSRRRVGPPAVASETLHGVVSQT